MDSKATDFRKFRQAILDFEAKPKDEEAKREFNNWRHLCFMNYPVGEVLKLQADTYAEVQQQGIRPSQTPKFPRRFTTTQHC